MGNLSESDSCYRTNEAKTQENVGGDYRVSKQDFWTLEKLAHHSSDGMRPTNRENESRWPISRERSEELQKNFVVFVLVSEFKH